MTKYDQQTVPTGAQVEALLREKANWNRWGANDQLGTLNLITPAKRRAAASLVRSGRSVSLSRPVPTDPAANNLRPADHHLMKFRPRGQHAGTLGDYLGVPIHGSSSTHIDSLNHIWDEEGGWNGWDLDDSISIRGGVRRGGIEQCKDGILTRGVLLDVPRHRGVAYVPEDQPVHGWELAEIAAAQGVSIQPGDALIINCGREAYELENPLYGSNQVHKPGLHASCLWFLRDLDVGMLVWDMQEAHPFGYDINFTIHGAIAAFGLSIVDNADLEALVEASKVEGRFEFMLSVAPLVVVGGTGSPVNPIATF